MAVRGYTSPGVSVQETISPSLAPLLSNPSVVAIVGDASGFQVATERVLLTETAKTLRYTGVDTTSLVVRNNSDNKVLNPGTYLVAAETDPDATITGDEPFSIALAPLPATPPTVSNAGTGTLVGDYVYAVSFVNPRGETGIGPASTSTTFSTSGANLSAIPVDASLDTATTGRNIYRAKVVSGVTGAFHLVATIGDNTTTTLTNETTDDATALLGQQPLEDVASGGTVVVTYNYTNQDYFKATFFDDFNDIVAKYGLPFDGDGNIDSPLSFAARVAFQNGASEIIALAAASGSDADLSAAFNELAAEDSVRIIVPVSGSAAVHSALVAAVTGSNTSGEYRQAVIGRDGTAEALDADTLRTAAKAINNEAIVMVSPSTFIMQNPITGRDLLVGGQYAAAAVAGMFAARDVQVPLTRKTVAGFSRLGEKRTATELVLDSQAGLLAISDRGGILQVRHGVTTAVSNINTGEASIVRAKYEMAHRLRDILDGSIVGTVLPINEAPLTVTNVISGVLEQLQVEGAISRYGNVSARLLDTDPTTIEGRFEYRPAYPINNIIVNFTINSSTGAFDLTASA